MTVKSESRGESAPASSALLREASAAMRAGDWARAAALFGQIVDADPDALPAWRMLATAATRIGDEPEAARALTEVVRLAPEDRRSAVSLGGLRSRQQRWAEAEAAYRAAACAENFAAVLPRLADILSKRKSHIDSDLSRAQSLKEETETAIKSYEKALADARSRAGDIARETRDAVTKQADAESHKLDEALAKKISDAEAKIAASKEKALAAVEDIAAESAAEIVAALGGGKVTKAAVTKALKG
jgi:F-type H+-transporting ATPase subunit b